MFNIDPSRETALYIHIPFCKSKCSYCAFFSKAGSSEGVIQSYVEKLLGEIKELNDWYGKPYSTVFIGGGNPGALDSKQLLNICKQCCVNGKPKEFSIEINPENLNETIEPCLEYINRISLGIQSLDESSLMVLGRNSTLKDTHRGIEISQTLRQRFGFALNYDLICCVPERSDAELKTVSSLFSIADFDHLSLYALTVENKTPLALAVSRGELKIMDDDVQADLLLSLWKEIKKRGMKHYEVSNFSYSGKQCLHNLSYWKMNQYVGLGPSAASTCYRPYSRIECSSNLSSYLSTPVFGSYETEVLNRTQEIEEWAIMGCRTSYGLSSRDCYKRFGFYLPVIDFPGFVSDSEGFRPAEEGFLLSDGAAAAIIEEIEKIEE